MILAAAPGYPAAALGPLATVLVFALGLLGMWWRARKVRRRAARETTGDIETSKAGEVWEASQNLTVSLTAQLTRAEGQRDRLLELQTTQTVPALTAVNTSLKDIGDVLKSMQAADRETRAAIHRLDERYGSGKR